MDTNTEQVVIDIEADVEMLLENIGMFLGIRAKRVPEIRYAVQQVILGSLEKTSCEKDLYEAIEKRFSEGGVHLFAVD